MSAATQCNMATQHPDLGLRHDDHGQHTHTHTSKRPSTSLLRSLKTLVVSHITHTTIGVLIGRPTCSFDPAHLSHISHLALARWRVMLPAASTQVAAVAHTRRPPNAALAAAHCPFSFTHFTHLVVQRTDRIRTVRAELPCAAL